MSTYDDPRVFGEGVIIFSNCVNSEKQCITLQVVEDILTEVSIVLNYQIKVNEAIDYLGNPNHVEFDRAGGELIACRDFLIGDEKQLVLASQVFEGSQAAEENCFGISAVGKISPNLLVSEVRYLSAAAMNELRTSSVSEFFEFSGTLSE